MCGRVGASCQGYGMASVGDNPIRGSEQDLLRRAGGAQSIAAGLRDVDASEGYVVAVVGPWGSGKTSVVNLVKEALEESPALPIVEFNPWMFSGTDELVHSFFRELAAQLRLKGPKLAGIAETVDEYSELLSPISLVPFIGAWYDRFRSTAKVFREYQEWRQGSVGDQKSKLSDELAKLDQPLVVVIDDIDRLESSEIRDIFKLVRLTASFPNIVYILAFDRKRVEDALEQAGFDGRAYLEKIIQLGYDVPPVANSVLLRLLGESLQEAVEDLGALERFDGDAWPDVLMEIVRPLVKNMRDVSRYCGAVRATSRTLGTQVELVDVMALEAVRVFLPDVFRLVVAGRDGLTTPSSDYGRGNEEPALTEQVNAVLAAGSTHPGVVRALISRLFPAARRHIGDSSYGTSWQAQWLRGRRVAHPDVLATYIEQVTNESLQAFNHAERAYSVLNDEDALSAVLREGNIADLEDVISALEAFEAEFPPEAAVPASRVLLNLLPDLPERPRGMMSFVDARLVVVRVVLRLLRRLESPEQVMNATVRILEAVESFASQFELITIVGHRENAGHKLVSEADAATLEQEFRERLAHASTAELVAERGLLRLMFMPKMYGENGEVVGADPRDLVLAHALLLDAQSVVRSQAMGSRTVHHTTRLNWDILVEVFGGEEAVQQAVDSLRGTEDEELAAVIALADKYLSGWRPSDFGDD